MLIEKMNLFFNTCIDIEGNLYSNIYLEWNQM